MPSKRVVKALVTAVLLVGVLAAPAPAGSAGDARAEPAGAAIPGRPGTPAPYPRKAPTGQRGLEIAVPAYVHADDPVLATLAETDPAPSIVVLNPNNGDAPFDEPWQERADALRRAVTATGEHTKVLGYVHTDHGNRDPAAVRASVDNYLRTADGELHVDGIFFDVVARDCGPDNSTRDRYASYRAYVQEVVHSLDPEARDLVVNNPGTAIADCYLEPGRRTADVFVTYEAPYAAYTAGGWLGGNVFNAAGGYRPGTEYDPSGTAFWHLVHEVPDAAAMRATLRTAFDRGAGYAYATDTTMPNPWDRGPRWTFRAQTVTAADIG
ncbi:spherulation-specific family 4 protein [Streptomyces sp. BI20]|uniref:spherulation-specific family 4 protein n=1 Tax=Streptomyces sp. BI20 TaxID=3403460 RepID=UPI003C763C3C